MPRTYFLGRESLGNDEPSPKVPSDSPRIHANRNSAEERRSDELLDKLSAARVVRDPDGNTVTLPRDQPRKPGFVRVGPAPAAKVTHKIVASPDGQHHRHATSVPLKNGWSHVAYVVPPGAPADIDKPITWVDPTDGSEHTTTEREHLAKQLNADAHEIRPVRYRTGRRLNLLSEGEGTPLEVVDDHDMAVPHGARNDPFTTEKK